MRNQYLDEIEKISWYKKEISRRIAREGLYPDDGIVDKRLDAIDKKLAIYQYKAIEEHEHFNTEKFNEDMRHIYQDLLILYKLAYYFSIKRYQQTKAYAETKLTELERLASRYEYKTRFEINSTSLGETVLFQTSGFPLDIRNSIATIDLGNITVAKGSKLACIFDADNIDQKNVIFTFGDPGENMSPYGYNKDFFSVPESTSYKTIEFNKNPDFNTIKVDPITPEGFVPDTNNVYMIYGGKDCINTAGLSYNKIVKKEPGTPFSLDTRAKEISFYVIGATYISFNFNKKPLSKNFSGYKIERMPSHKKIVIECPEDFVFDYVTDGTIMAVRERGIIQNNILYFPKAYDISDYRVEEYTPNETITYPTKVTIHNIEDASQLKINAIAIKELSTLNGTEEL